MTDQPSRIGFIGIGLLGRGLALALSARGYLVTGASSRSFSSAQWLSERVDGCRAYDSPQALADESDLVFITTPDSVIAEVASRVTWRSGQGVVHCSGASSTEILRPAALQGAAVGAMHPFQTFAGLTRAEDAEARLKGIAFAVAGELWLPEYLDQMVRALGGHPVNIPDRDRPLYHASAILGCGYLAALLQAAVDCWTAIGYTEEEALAALVPLAGTTIENIGRNGVAPSVTGPAVRGDVATMKTHLEALGDAVPSGALAYGALTSASLALAERRGVSPEAVAGMRRLASQYLRRWDSCPE